LGITEFLQNFCWCFGKFSALDRSSQT